MRRYHLFNYVCLLLSIELGLLELSTAYAHTSDRHAAKRLNWVSTSDPANICHGYFKPIEIENNAGTEETQIHVDQASLAAQGVSLLKGNVKIQQLDRNIQSQEATVFRNESGEIQQLDFYKNVKFQEKDKLILANEGRWFSNQSWSLLHVLYRLQPEDQKETYSWGRADRVHRRSDHTLHLERASYSTCSPEHIVWQLESKQLILDPVSGRGHSNGTKLKILSVPVFYFPYFTFPIDRRRQSGWLFPTMGHSERSGWKFSAPYYFNLAPNYDLTLTPQSYSERGASLSGLFRYLDITGTGEFHAYYLPSDDAFSNFQQDEMLKNPPGRRVDRLEEFSSDRWSVSLQDKHQWNNHWSSEINFNQVSDDYYFQDFGHSLIKLTENQIAREGVLNYSDEHNDAFIRAQKFQTLHPINQPSVTDPYARLPQIGYNWNYSPYKQIWTMLGAEIVYFDKANDPDTGAAYTTGYRMHLQPDVHWSYYQPFGFIIPRLQFPMTSYTLNHATTEMGEHPHQAIPMFSVDTGVYFDRFFSLGQQDYQQTLEPHLFYLYVPYRNQSDIPVFDTTIPTFDITQLYRDNRFSGYDRVGDANQLSIGFTSRLLESDTSNERFRFSIGQILYFRNRQVTLCNTPGCSDTTDLSGVINNKTPVSPIVGNLTYQLNSNWYAMVDSTWDQNYNESISHQATLHYQPQGTHNKILDFSYQYIRNGELKSLEGPNLEQAKVGFYWPIKHHWGTIGHISYNMTQHHTQLYFLGLEYTACCWAARIVGEHSFVALNPQGHPQFDNSIYLQLQLSGLGKIGHTRAKRVITDNIRGYQDFFESV